VLRSKVKGRVVRERLIWPEFVSQRTTGVDVEEMHRIRSLEGFYNSKKLFKFLENSFPWCYYDIFGLM